MPKPDGGQAFPLQDEIASGEGGTISMRDWPMQRGMTLRQWYAGKALQGIVSNPGCVGQKPEILSELAFVTADAMIAEGNKE